MSRPKPMHRKSGISKGRYYTGGGRVGKQSKA